MAAGRAHSFAQQNRRWMAFFGAIVLLGRLWRREICLEHTIPPPPPGAVQGWPINSDTRSPNFWPYRWLNLAIFFVLGGPCRGKFQRTNKMGPLC